MSEPLVRPLTLPELTPRETEPPPTTTPSPGNVVETVREGQRIARAIIARATAQAREIQAAAEEEGIERGTSLAREREGKALRDAAAALVEATARLDLTLHDIHDALQERLPELAVTIAERILRHELVVRPETLVQILRDAVAAVLPAARIEIRLHPDDIATVERHRALLDDVLGATEVRFEPAPEVGRGGSAIETESMTLPAGLPQQIERALALLKGDEACR